MHEDLALQAEHLGASCELVTSRGSFYSGYL